MKTLFTFLFITLLSVSGLVAQNAGDAAFVAGWSTPLPTWFATLPAVEPIRQQATTTSATTFDAASADFDAEWAKIPGTGNIIGGTGHVLGLAASATGPDDFKDAAFKVVADDNNMYILLKYTDDDVTGDETVEVAWAPYLKINAPDLAALPQAWYARYQQFGAYKASFKKTGFDAAMMINGAGTDANSNINWGGTNDLLTPNLFIDDKTTVGSKTVKQIITLGFPVLTGEARPEFTKAIWNTLNEGKGISFDLKVNDIDANDALNADATPVKKPAEYWWNSTNNDCYALTTYAGFLSAPASDPSSGDAAYVASWLTPLPTWFAALPAVEPVRQQASATKVASFDAAGANFDTEWNKIGGTGNIIGGTGHVLGLAASATGPDDFKDGAFKTVFDDANIYILLQYTDDDVTGNETVEVAWAPYLNINAPDLATLPQAWYARYQQFGAYKATFKKTGFDAAMMINGAGTDANANINWGGTNDILSANLFLDNKTAVGSHTTKQIITIGFAALTGEARPEFNQAIWTALNDGKGISFDLKVNDVDANDALNADATPVQKPAEYWWNSTNNDCYALTAYAGFLNDKGIVSGIANSKIESSIFGRTSSFQIQLTKSANVTVYNALGQQMRVLRNVTMVDLSDMTTGVYIIRANNETKKFFR